MALEIGPVAEITADLMDRIEEEYPDAQFEDAVVIVEVSFDRDGETYTAGRYHSTTHRASTILGLLALTDDNVRGPAVELDEDE